MLIILSPSKTQHCNKNYAVHSSQPVFFEKALYLANHLKSLNKKDLAQLMKLSEKLTEATLQRIKGFSPPLMTTNSNQALFTFQGDAYTQMKPESYSEKQLSYAQEHLHILSGLYGILRPLDLIFPYRLEMGLKMATAKGDNLYDYWGDGPTDFINSSLDRLNSRVVINLASNEYFKVIKPKKLRSKIVTIAFNQQKDGQCRSIAIYAKRARGLMTHYAIGNKIVNADDLKKFCLDGYSFRPEESTQQRWVFLKDISGA